MQPSPEITFERVDLSAAAADRATSEAFLAAFDTSRVPAAPGCYIMKDGKNRPIYVGKAKNLRARIRNYINESDTRYSVKFLMGRVAAIDFLVTGTEKEALLLENSLIKQHKPRYNVRLKDDKTYISLRLNRGDEFPRITVVRRYKKDGAMYFGPYHSAGAVYQTLKQLQRLFPMRTCTDHVLKNRTRPCLYFQMKQCVAPCVGHMDRAGYHELVEQAVMVLEGRSAELEKVLLERIRVASEAMEFEKAGILRDRLYDLRTTLERQRTVGISGAEDRDVFGYFNEGSFTEIQILFYRGGKMLGGRVYSFQRREMPVDELLSSFLLQYYSDAPAVPGEVLVPLDLEDADALSELLSEQRGAKVTVQWAQRGEKRALVDMAMRNAQKSFEQKQLKERANIDTLEQLQEALNLPVLPRRIECFDISTIQGAEKVASMVVFEEGEAAKNRYRRYAIKDVEGQDDFASMREVLMRRFTRAIQENDLPDFVLIDGGKGQLNVATAVFKDLGLNELPHAGIAKSRLEESGHSPERFFVPGRMNPIILPQSGPVIQLVTRIRDEAHRFAITYHRKKRKKAALRTSLTNIAGVGQTRAKALLQALGSVTRVKAATVEEIAAVPGFSQKSAEAVYAALHGDTTPSPRSVAPEA